MNSAFSFRVYLLGAFSQDWIMQIFAIKVFHNECVWEGVDRSEDSVSAA